MMWTTTAATLTFDRISSSDIELAMTGDLSNSRTLAGVSAAIATAGHDLNLASTTQTSTGNLGSRTAIEQGHGRADHVLTRPAFKANLAQSARPICEPWKTPFASSWAWPNKGLCSNA